MNCTEFLAQLTDYFDGQVDADLMAEVEHHIAECRHCEVVLDSTTKTINIYRDHELYDFSPAFEEKLCAAIMDRCCGPAAMGSSPPPGTVVKS